MRGGERGSVDQAPSLELRQGDDEAGCCLSAVLITSYLHKREIIN